MTEYNSTSEYLDSLPQEHRDILNAYFKIKQRFYRKGKSDDSVKVGRPRTTDAQKRQKRIERLQRIRDAEKAKKIANGTYRPPGKPRVVVSK